ncbi:sterol desaturase family protein [Fulvivirga sp. 29W222]|uniref:Sterol desaturase family protein n=1 Tax=Fulvivirga marina TaxID=2494733 RepID=A0A937KF72_9BACT|nr:sterol desaturase family protein [Fulvivirga marina]MBL6447903.1 sterol desaturase family protein [Fulvivirga marina]
MQDNWQFIVLIILLRYVIVAGIAYLTWYVLKRRAWSYKKIQVKFPQNKDYLREITYSLVTIIIFTTVAMTLFSPWVKPHTLIYDNIPTLGIAYFILSIVMIIFVHDTYFYWMHRLMHHKKLYRITHLVHHKSTNPSPWAAFAFHPIEAFIEAGIIILTVFLFPVHKLAIALFLIFMIIYNVYGHLGYELYPKGFYKHWLGKWLNTSVNHNMHHEYVKGNYGLYFTFWDRLMGTIHMGYEARFDEVKNRITNKNQ